MGHGDIGDTLVHGVMKTGGTRELGVMRHGGMEDMGTWRQGGHRGMGTQGHTRTWGDIGWAKRYERTWGTGRHGDTEA